MSEAPAIGFDVVKFRMQSEVLTLAREFAPGGKVDGRYYVAPNPRRDGDRAGSFKVWLTGPSAGAFREYDGGQDEAGDIIDLPIYCGRLRDRSEVLAWALERYGFKTGDTKLREQRIAEAKAGAAEAEAKAGREREQRRKLAARLFAEARVLVPGSVTWRYLTEARGIPLSRLPGQLNDIRHDPVCLHIDDQGVRSRMPAMVGAMRDGKGAIGAAHRTYLDAATANKIAGQAKKMLGASKGCAIRIWPGAGIGPRGLILTEGIEDAASCAVAMPEYGARAVGSLNGLASFELEAGHAWARLIVFADNDWTGGPAARAFEAAMRRLSTLGLPVSVARSPVGKDANDLIRSMKGD